MTERMRKKRLRAAAGWMLTALFVLLFGAVYEYFSFGVWSGFMIYAFLFPLLLGFLPCYAAERRGRTEWTGAASEVWRSGVATLTAGSLFRGILDIYGTTNRIGTVYWAVGGALLAAGLLLQLLPAKQPARQPKADSRDLCVKTR